MMRVEVHYFAAARAARGLNTETLTVGNGVTVTQALEAVARTHEQTPHEQAAHEQTPREAAPDADARESLAAVFARCSFLVNAEASPADSVLDDGDRVDVLPPFAGG